MYPDSRTVQVARVTDSSPFEKGEREKVRRVRDTSDLDRLDPVVQKPINVNPRLRINQGVSFSTPKCCSTLIFGKTLH